MYIREKVRIIIIIVLQFKSGCVGGIEIIRVWLYIQLWQSLERWEPTEERRYSSAPVGAQRRGAHQDGTPALEITLHKISSLKALRDNLTYIYEPQFYHNMHYFK